MEKTTKLGYKVGWAVLTGKYGEKLKLVQAPSDGGDMDEDFVGALTAFLKAYNNQNNDVVALVANGSPDCNVGVMVEWPDNEEGFEDG